MTTTIARVKLIAPEISKLSDEAIDIHIEDAFMTVESKKFPSKYQEVATRYLAAHLATSNTKYVKSEAVGTLKREYSDKNIESTDLNSTPYGQEYLRLEKEYTGKRKGLSLVVV